jgi:hypothetical protein
VYVVTEHDTVFAFDADTKQPPVWQVSFLSAGVTPVPPADTGETADLVPEHVFGYPGGTPSVSSNGTNAGIVWVIEGDGYTPSRPAVLHAYDART